MFLYVLVDLIVGAANVLGKKIITPPAAERTDLNQPGTVGSPAFVRVMDIVIDASNLVLDGFHLGVPIHRNGFVFKNIELSVIPDTGKVEVLVGHGVSIFGRKEEEVSCRAELRVVRVAVSLVLIDKNHKTHACLYQGHAELYTNVSRNGEVSGVNTQGSKKLIPAVDELFESR